MLLQTLSHIESPDAQANILRGMNASLKGRHGLAAPAGWDALYEKLKSSPNEEVRRQAQALAVTFGGGAALAEMLKMLVDNSRRWGRAPKRARITARGAGTRRRFRPV